MHGTVGRGGRVGGSPLPGMGTAWPPPCRDVGLLPTDGAEGRGRVWAQAARAAGGRNGGTGGERRGEGSGFSRGMGSPGAAWTCSGKKSWGSGERERERRGGPG